MKISHKNTSFGNVFDFENTAGMKISLSSLGAGIRSVSVPDRKGESRVVTLRPLNELIAAQSYHGKTVGRTAGRIAGATFTIDGRTAFLEKNNFGTDNLHGGSAGLHLVDFSARLGRFTDYCDAVFFFRSPDGEGGYFGNIDITVTYRIYERENKFAVYFGGMPDCKTLLNLTNHVYLNLSGDLSGSAAEHSLFIDADRVGVLNGRSLIGDIIPVPREFDFRTPHIIGDFINDAAVQRNAGGYDHTYFFNHPGSDKVKCALQSGGSGIRLEIRTTYPCVVVYTDNYPVEGEQVARGVTDKKYLAVCLECQYNPDGVHLSPDDCGIITPDRPYAERIEYSFSVVR